MTIRSYLFSPADSGSHKPFTEAFPATPHGNAAGMCVRIGESSDADDRCGDAYLPRVHKTHEYRRLIMRLTVSCI